ncbi:phospholipid-transporting ATPase 1 [Pseudohyphozyma bogoriensis]|nr:phospholipid-transporting ATPase 1 [Pseudohyphozyma bogoriensis]
MLFKSVLSLAALFVASVSATDMALQPRQAIVARSQSAQQLQRQRNSCYTQLTKLHSNTSPHVGSCSNIVSQLKTCKPEKRPSRGAQLSTNLQYCHRTLTQCNPGASTSPTTPQPSGISTGGTVPTTGTCAAIAGTFSAIVNELIELIDEIDEILHFIPQFAETIKGTLGDIDDELCILMESTEATAPGTRVIAERFSTTTLRNYFPNYYRTLNAAN